MIVFNLVGLVMLVIGFGVAFGVDHLLGPSAEGPLMLIAGLLVALMDGGYRTQRPGGHWLRGSGGGSLFFLPVWMFGVLWLVLGAIYTIRGHN